MNNQDDGARCGTTYLEMYWQPNDGNERIVHHQLRDDDAYETWVLALYFKEILCYKHLMAESELTLLQLPLQGKEPPALSDTCLSTQI